MSNNHCLQHPLHCSGCSLISTCLSTIEIKSFLLMFSLPRQTLDNRSRTVLLERSIDVSEIIWNVALVLSIVASTPVEAKDGSWEKQRGGKKLITFISVQADQWLLCWERLSDGTYKELGQILLSTLDTHTLNDSPWVPFSCLGSSCLYSNG